MANRYSRALKQIKDKTLDEKLQLLSEIPTNNAGGLYQDVPGEFEIPDPVQLLPRAADLEQDGDGAEGYTGNDTTGLFLDDGTILIEEPPGDRSYVLGPMMSMWYAWANYTQIGYVRQSDRKMVNLGRIVGEMSAWDGETGFTSYGQLTLEQAVWFKEQSRSDYRAFYPGPPSNPADPYGRYLGSMINTPKPITYQGPTFWDPGTQRGPDPTDVFGLMMDYVNQLNKTLSQSINNMIDMFGDTNAAAANAEHNVGSEIPSVRNVHPDAIDSYFNQNLLGRGLRSATDQLRYSGDTMYQGNPAGRSPGLSNYWSPDPATAGTYSNPGAGKGVPGAKPNPTGTITTAQRPPNTPRVTRSPLGQPQFKFPKGSPPPGKMLTQMADSAAVSAGRKAAATTAGKTLGRAVPLVSIGIAAADATVRASNGDYAGAVLSGISAVPGPIGWAALGVQIATDAVGVTGVSEEQEFNNYDLRPLKLMHHIDPTSYDPSVQARFMDGTMIPVDYSGRTPCCKAPAEQGHNFPFRVSGVNVPFQEVPSMPPSPLGGDNPVISSAFSYDGRLGQQISPAENSSYYGTDSMTGIGATKTLVEWSQDYTLLKISDDSIRGIPSAPGMGKGEIILYRR